MAKSKDIVACLREYAEALRDEYHPGISPVPLSQAVGEIERLQVLLHRCWPAVWVWEYSDVFTTIDTTKLLEDMDEFMRMPEALGPV